MRDVSDLILGSALWGWRTDRTNAFSILRRFYEWGGRTVDTATNYPMNGMPDDFMMAERWLADWCQAEGVSDLYVTVKVGGIANDGRPEANLRRSFLLIADDHYQRTLGDNFKCLSVHWDHRDNSEEILDTFQGIRDIADHRDIGLSGIKHPDLYAKLAPDLIEKWRIQIKYSLLNRGSYDVYDCFHHHARFYAYGIMGGGLKFGGQYREGSSIRLRNLRGDPRLESVKSFVDSLPESPTKPQNFAQLALLYVYNSPHISGIIIGPATQAQLEDTMTYYQRLGAYDTSGIFSDLALAFLPSW